MKEIKNANSTLRWIGDEIVHVKWKPEVEVSISDIDELEISFNKMVDGRRVKVLSEMGKYVSISNEAKKHAAERSPKMIGIAYVVDGLAQRLILRFYIKLRKRKNPARVFDSFEDALLWLNSF